MCRFKHLRSTPGGKEDTKPDEFGGFKMIAKNYGLCVPID